MSFNLLEDYKSLLKETLLKAKLPPADVETVLANIEVDRGVFFSLNRKIWTRISDDAKV